MTFDFDAFVTAVLFDSEDRAWFALGDGTLRTEDGGVHQAHDGAVLCAAPHPTGQGILTGGDDGAVVWTRASGPVVLEQMRGRWIDALAASSQSGLFAWATGREVHVRDAADPQFQRTFVHERSVTDLAFDPRGRRLAAATYGGAWLWYARIAEQKPEVLKWAGSHIALAWSPDGKFLMSAMQENALHGWRVADDKNLKMGGYPAKVKSLAFLSKGQMLATSGANGVVVWPFSGPAGPLGKQAAEVGYDESVLVARVAGDPDSRLVAAGLEDGRVWTCDLSGQKIDMRRAEKGEAVSALSFSRRARRLAWGDEAGAAGVFEV
ncbi:WD40 repeat domain-containing protein [Phenylobacterium sp.]|jgi:WD40 repeat protein|uniref:WD40 repeat domain-containing protein n=1 Tax=Phenylobacterium sp. TaxID=1871053 RepID=UPI0025EACDC8|nr:WD40 repeat domain-containing protein [Phenylobacterium sp.]MCA3720023.1 WD40 repeat domain-containing protein [Phenylobacterium sp.]